MAIGSETSGKKIDLNLNLAEHYGLGREALERDLLPFASSVSIATGAHTGDIFQANLALEACQAYPNTSIGALISYPDVIGFGIRKVQLTREELRATILAQLGALTALAKQYNYELNHVRIHGYLYHQMLTNYSVAETVTKTIQDFSQWLIIVAPYSKVLKEVISWVNLRVSYEARVDLRYDSEAHPLAYEYDKDGNLDINVIADRARKLIYDSKVVSEEGIENKIQFETIHLPSSPKNALEIAKLLKGMVPVLSSLEEFDYSVYLPEFL